VATDVGSVHELVRPGESGVLVPTGDVEKLAEGIGQVLSDPATSALWGQNGRARVYPSLDGSRLVNDIETLYFKLLREKKIIPQ
jgi:glycosyltransferase involved in cell wall biosynthesis